MHKVVVIDLLPSHLMVVILLLVWWRLKTCIYKCSRLSAWSLFPFGRVRSNKIF